jgi:hypothetical protein
MITKRKRMSYVKPWQGASSNRKASSSSASSIRQKPQQQQVDGDKTALKTLMKL